MEWTEVKNEVLEQFFATVNNVQYAEFEFTFTSDLFGFTEIKGADGPTLFDNVGGVERSRFFANYNKIHRIEVQLGLHNLPHPSVIIPTEIDHEDIWANMDMLVDLNIKIPF